MLLLLPFPHKYLFPAFTNRFFNFRQVTRYYGSGSFFHDLCACCISIYDRPCAACHGFCHCQAKRFLSAWIYKHIRCRIICASSRGVSVLGRPKTFSGKEAICPSLSPTNTILYSSPSLSANLKNVERPFLSTHTLATPRTTNLFSR